MDFTSMVSQYLAYSPSTQATGDRILTSDLFLFLLFLLLLNCLFV